VDLFLGIHAPTTLKPSIQSAKLIDSFHHPPHKPVQTPSLAAHGTDEAFPCPTVDLADKLLHAAILDIAGFRVDGGILHFETSCVEELALFGGETRVGSIFGQFVKCMGESMGCHIVSL
jgi:hypothetical protein